MIRSRPRVGPAIAVTLAACQAAAPVAPSISGRAALAVGLPDGSFETACIAFDGAEVSGAELLEASGLAVSSDATNALGPLVCGIEGVGCDFPRQDCLCECRGVGGCSYWAYLNWHPDDGWRYSALGAGQRRVHDGDLDAWIWLDRATPADRLPTPPPEITFAALCG